MTGSPAVLVVDDDVMLLTALARGLSDYGCQVVTASSSEVGLKAAENGRFVAMIVDLQMPGYRAPAFLRRLRTLQPRSICIIYTGEVLEDEAVATLKREGADHVVTKPAEFEEITSLMRLSPLLQ